MIQINRRQCLLRSAGSLLGASLLAAPSIGRAAQPNDEIRIGVIGVRLRGSQLVDAFHRLNGVQVVAISDADSLVTDAVRTQLRSPA